MTEYPFSSAFKFKQVLLSLLKTTYLKYRFSEDVCFTWLTDTEILFPLGLNSQNNGWMLFRDRGKQWGRWQEAIQFHPQISWSCIWSLWGWTFQSASLCHISLNISQSKSKQVSFPLPAALKHKDASVWTWENIILLYKTYLTMKSVVRWLCSPCASAFYLAKSQTPHNVCFGPNSRGIKLARYAVRAYKSSRVNTSNLLM